MFQNLMNRSDQISDRIRFLFSHTNGKNLGFCICKLFSGKIISKKSKNYQDIIELMKFLLFIKIKIKTKFYY